MGGFALGKRQRHQERAAGVKRRLFFRLTGHDGAIDLKTSGLGDHLMEAERLIQHLRIRQEGVGDNAQLAAAVQMANRAADQRLGGFEAYGPILLGLNAPINDLSRGCNAQEVYSMAIITAALA